MRRLSEKERKRRAVAMGKQWDDPEFQGKRDSRLYDPEVQARKGAAMSKVCIKRKKMLAHLKAFSKAPEQRKANSQRTKALWKDPEYRKKMMIALGELNHVWLMLPDGRVLDPTADQFNLWFPHKKYPLVYLGKPLDIHGNASLFQ